MSELLEFETLDMPYNIKTIPKELLGASHFSVTACEETLGSELEM